MYQMSHTVEINFKATRKKVSHCPQSETTFHGTSQFLQVVDETETSH